MLQIVSNLCDDLPAWLEPSSECSVIGWLAQFSSANIQLCGVSTATPGCTGYLMTAAQMSRLPAQHHYASRLHAKHRKHVLDAMYCSQLSAKRQETCSKTVLQHAYRINNHTSMQLGTYLLPPYNATPGAALSYSTRHCFMKQKNALQDHKLSIKSSPAQDPLSVGLHLVRCVTGSQASRCTRQCCRVPLPDASGAGRRQLPGCS